jgi:hypothetical protein
MKSSRSPKRAWTGINNGELLTRAQAQFDIFVTVDRNLAFQQNIPQFTIAVIVLQAPTNRLRDLQPLLPKLFQTLSTAPKGRVSHVIL